MNSEEIKYCPCTLAEGFSTYSPSALRKMFFGKKVSHILNFDAPEMNEEIAEQFRQNSKILSVSGAQFKQSLLLDKKNLRLTKPGEQGQFILKPIPLTAQFSKAEELAANEHLTMQIARQVYSIRTAECALIFFKNGHPAYITKRFDIATDGKKIAQEDFASLSGKSKNSDENYRSSGSYEDIARIMKNFVVAYQVEATTYFERVVFNYLFSNGDAHLKNFSLQQTSGGDYIFSPAYDLLDTTIHIPNDSFFGLIEGLFSDEFETDSFKVLGYYAYDDFYAFGLKIGLAQSRLKKLLDKYRIENNKVKSLIQRSFLSEPTKEVFYKHYSERIKMLNNSYSEKLKDQKS